MNDKLVTRVHWSFWLISIIALLWNVGGSINFFMQMDPEMVAGYRESERAIIDGRPFWATAGFAIGVFGGAIGSVLLLFRKTVAYYVFIVSLIGIIVTMIHTISVANSKFSFSPAEIGVMIISPVIVALILIWYAKWSEIKGWIR